MRYPNEIEKVYEASDGESVRDMLGPLDIEIPIEKEFDKN